MKDLEEKATAYQVGDEQELKKAYRVIADNFSHSIHDARKILIDASIPIEVYQEIIAKKGKNSIFFDKKAPITTYVIASQEEGRPNKGQIDRTASTFHDNSPVRIIGTSRYGSIPERPKRRKVASAASHTKNTRKVVSVKPNFYCWPRLHNGIGGTYVSTEALSAREKDMMRKLGRL
jgi:hypothetical protein